MLGAEELDLGLLFLSHQEISIKKKRMGINRIGLTIIIIVE